MPPEVREFVSRFLMPRLLPEEREQLKNVDAKGEGLARVLVDLTERRLSLPPGRNPILFYDDLPEEARKHARKINLEKTGKWRALAEKEGRWPDFALAFVEVVPEDARKHAFPPLGAARPQDFSPEVRVVIEKLRRDNPGDAERLHKFEGRWPEYPRLLGDLARKHNLNLPGMTLPGPRDWWEHRN
jgi:hypothetical protein